MVTLSQALLYYKRPEIQKAIVKHAQDKEISGSFNMQGFSKRPDILEYPADVLEMVKRGITSFHCSEELWHEPLQISPTLTKKQLNEIRKGWDLLLDIDCKELEFSKIAAHYLVEALKYQGIKSVYVKFSGNHGFHICVPFEAFPQKVQDQEIKDLFPEAPRKIAEYLKFMIESHLRKALLEKYSKEEISNLIEKPLNEITKKGVLQPFTFLEIDTILISSRHLYRMPYSFNEKSGLVSIPIEPEKVLEFTKEYAKPENVKVTEIPFIERDIEVNQANKLFVQAFDFKPTIKKEKEIKRYEQQFEDLQEAVPEQFFPPCMHNILKGMEDGKKRAVFILNNFLSNIGWNKTQIKQRIHTWNKQNPEPLKEVYLKGQLRYKTKVLPPNCQNMMYYKDMHICKPDNLCQRTKNPVNYARRKIFAHSKTTSQKTGRPKLTEEQKAMRKAYRERLQKENELL